MQKLSVRHVISIKKISKRDIGKEEKMIEEMRKCVKKDEGVQKKFKKYDVPLDKIDDVHIEFADLDVSAKTKDKKIYINRGLIDQIDDLTHYVAHEMIHFLQQYVGATRGHEATDDYLHKSTEQEAYRVQLNFKEENESPEESQRYLDDLLDYHDKDGEESKELKEKLNG